MKTRYAFSGLMLGLLVVAAAGIGLPQTASAQAMRPLTGFNANALAGNDDGSTGLVGIFPSGSAINFFGNNYASLYVNNNGNVTFASPLGTFTPFGLTTNLGTAIIAPFFADVDTRVGNVVTYGSDTVDGHQAFGVNWPGVGCFSNIISVLNNFQVVLIDRPDIAPGDFDIEFNYDQIQWETGQASGGSPACLGGSSVRVGYSNGTGAAGTNFELTGSGINGYFLDTNLTTGLKYNSVNSEQPGRYVFRVRGGIPVPDVTITTAASGLNFPMGVAVGSVYIADRNNHRVVKIGTSPTDLIVVAGTGDAGYNGDGGLATAAQLNSPTGVAVDASGNLFIADSQNHIIRKVVLSTGVISTVAGTPTKFGVAVNGGLATDPSCGAAPAPPCPTLFNPRGVAVDGSGNIYIADTMNQQIRKVVAPGTAGALITQVAGVAGTTGNNDGPASCAPLTECTPARLNSPLGVAVNTAGTLVYIADEGNDSIRMVNVDGVHTVPAGSLEAPAGVAVATDGTLYIADTNNHRIRRVSGETVDTVAGTGTAGSAMSELNTPVAVSADGCVLYIADLINQRIQKVDFCGGA